MKKEVLTELEIAKISSHNSNIERLKQTIQQAQAKIKKHQQEIDKILSQIKERAGLKKDFPNDRLSFKAVDFVEHQGAVIIKDEEVDD